MAELKLPSLEDARRIEELRARAAAIRPYRRITDDLHAPQFPRLSDNKIECARCGAPLRVIETRPMYQDDLILIAMTQLAYCEHDNVWHSWRVRCNELGLPSGRPLDGLVQIEKTSHAEWLTSQYGHLLGVIQR